MVVTCNTSLTFVDFVDNVEGMRLRGTSKLFRADPAAFAAMLAAPLSGQAGAGGAGAAAAAAAAIGVAGVGGAGATSAAAAFALAMSPPGLPSQSEESEIVCARCYPPCRP